MVDHTASPRTTVLRRRGKRRTVLAGLLLLGALSPAPLSAQQERPGKFHELFARKTASSEPQEPVRIETRTTAESRAGVRRLRIGEFQYLSDSERDYAGYDLGAGSWDTFAAVLGSAVADEFVTQAAIARIRSAPDKQTKRRRPHAVAGSPMPEQTRRSRAPFTSKRA